MLDPNPPTPSRYYGDPRSLEEVPQSKIDEYEELMLRVHNISNEFNFLIGQRQNEIDAGSDPHSRRRIILKFRIEAFQQAFVVFRKTVFNYDLPNEEYLWKQYTHDGNKPVKKDGRTEYSSVKGRGVSEFLKYLRNQNEHPPDSLLPKFRFVSHWVNRYPRLLTHIPDMNISYKLYQQTWKFEVESVVGGWKKVA